jgi:hypothetical protein
MTGVVAPKSRGKLLMLRELIKNRFRVYSYRAEYFSDDGN